MKLDKALYQMVLNELTKAIEALENVEKLGKALDSSYHAFEREFHAIKVDYDAIHGKHSFLDTPEWEALHIIASNLEYCSGELTKRKIVKIINSLKYDRRNTVEPLVKAAEKLD